MAQLLAKQTALIVVDVQKAFDEWEASGKRRNNPNAILRIAELLADFRVKAVPIIHIRHASLNPNSRFKADRPGFAVEEEAREQEREAVITKHVNSAFIGTVLEARLRGAPSRPWSSSARPPITVQRHRVAREAVGRDAE